MSRARFMFDRLPGWTVFLAGLLSFLATEPAHARQVLLVVSATNGAVGVGQYSAVTGATINPDFISVVGGGHKLALDGNNHLFVSNILNNTVGEYNTTTGATINATFVNGQGLNLPAGLAVDRSNHLFVSNFQGSGGTDGWVGQYNAATGATVNARFINSAGEYVGNLALDTSNHLFVDHNFNSVDRYDATTGAPFPPFINLGTGSAYEMVVDALNHLFVVNNNYSSGNPGFVSEYDATTGAAINAAFITGLNDPIGLALDGKNHLFVSDLANNTVGEYDATTGAIINAGFITGINSPGDMVFVAPVPEPSSLLLVAGAATAAVGIWRRRPIPL
jgi:hypothetical protein